MSGVHRCDYNNILISAASDKKDAAIAKEFKQKYWDLSKVVFGDGPAPPSIKSVAPKTATQGITLFAKKVTDAFSKPIGPPPAASELMPNEDWIALWQTYEKGALRKKERSSARNQVMIQEKADKTKDLHLRINYSQFDRRLIYLPVFKCSYVYNSQSYKFYVNGQNGTESVVVVVVSSRSFLPRRLTTFDNRRESRRRETRRVWKAGRAGRGGKELHWGRIAETSYYQHQDDEATNICLTIELNQSIRSVLVINFFFSIIF